MIVSEQYANLAHMFHAVMVRDHRAILRLAVESPTVTFDRLSLPRNGDRPSSGCGDDSVLDGVLNEFGSAVDSQLLHYAIFVKPDSAL